MKKRLFLLDVFSYSCMNCMRSMRFIKKIDRKYRRYGLRTLIIHPPEWGFEKSRKNIVDAANKNRIKFPIVIDSKKRLINKLGVDFWPAQILFGNGRALYKHIGEGNYRELEGSIIKMLGIKTKRIFHKEPKYSKFPAIYLGSRKNNFKGTIRINGKHSQTKECIRFSSDGTLTLPAEGSIVSMVAQSAAKKPVKIRVYLNNRPIREVAIGRPGMYNIARLNHNSGKYCQERNTGHRNTLTLKTKPGLAAYSFSFE